MNSFQEAVKEVLPPEFISDHQLAAVIEAVTSVQDKLRLTELASSSDAQ